MTTLAELERAIIKYAKMYDNAVSVYNTQIQKEFKAGNITKRKSTVIIKKTVAGKNAGKRLVTCYNKIARIGQKLKKYMVEYNKRVALLNRRAALKNKTKRRK